MLEQQMMCVNQQMICVKQQMICVVGDYLVAGRIHLPNRSKNGGARIRAQSAILSTAAFSL